ncbi:hypothetical protein [Tannockella kyphosi]|uniref:hypothetical protein n=1 Tax=Tannockella kyphosi TaxID=2899121 RepID=UPI0020128067|nr:hypothetical protein [Tannockella kyphosi]
MSVKELLAKHQAKYPVCQNQDLAKFVYQYVFGGEHMIENKDIVLEKIVDECANLTNRDYWIEDIGNQYVRFHLFQANHLQCQTIAQLFITSCTFNKKNNEQFYQIMEQLKIDVPKGELKPFRHSQLYRDTYHPHYRIINKQLAFYYPLFLKINELLETKETLIIAIDGMAGSGKSTLAALLQEFYQANVFHLDDFFLQSHQRTQERFSIPGKNVDYERFLEQVLLPCTSHQQIGYQKFLCHQMELDKEVSIFQPSRVSIVEGSYSMIPELSANYDLKIALKVDSKTQLERISKRNTKQQTKLFEEKWIPYENKYFSYYDIFHQVDYLFDTTKLYK